MFDTDSVWKRTTTNDPIISDIQYNLTIGLVLLWGFAVNFVTATVIPVSAVEAIPSIILFIGYFISCFAGVSLYTRSDVPSVSFLGYNFVVVPMGIVIMPFVASFESNVIAEAMGITGGITICMMGLGSLYPKIFLSMGRTLVLALISLIVVELAAAFLFGVQSSIFDLLFCGIFSLYIGYDWARANQIPKTLDNAVDSAASLYVDIVNLFIRILASRRR